MEKKKKPISISEIQDILKQRELDLRAVDLQRKQQTEAVNHAMDASRFKVDTLMRQHEIEVKDRQSNDRLEIAKDKIDLLRQKYDTYDQNKNVPK